MLDLVIRGAEVIDGSGSAGVITDVGIEGDQITLIGDPGPAHHEIDGTGLVRHRDSSIPTRMMMALFFVIPI